MNKVKPTATTEEILLEIGQRLKRYRLQQNRTAAEVAAAAGLAARTVERAESGERPTFETVIQILRALGRLDALNAFLPAPLVSPMQLVQTAGQERRRAGTSRHRTST